MNLNLQIEDQKRKSNLICDFVIETAYIKELASQVLNADETVKHFPKQGSSINGRLNLFWIKSRHP